MPFTSPLNVSAKESVATPERQHRFQKLLAAGGRLLGQMTRAWALMPPYKAPLSPQ